MESQKLGEILIKHGAIKKDDVNNALLIQEKIRNGLKKGQQLQDIKLGEILVKNDIITASQLKQALEEQELSGGSIGKQLSKLGFVKDSELVSFLSKEFGAATINLLSSEIPSDVIKLIPPDTALKYRVVPYKRQGNTLYLAVSDPTKVTVLEDIKFYTGLNVEVVLASESEINQALSSYYNASTILTDHKDYIDSISIEDTNEKIDISEMQKSSSEKPIIQFVNKVLADGIRRGASDLHFEPYENNIRVRFRIDGKLNEIMTVPGQLKNAISSRIKIMSQMDIAERRMPQDGRIKVKVENKEVDIRVSCLPILYGEKIVMRILDKSSLQLDMGKLGFSENQLNDFQSAIHKPYGMILVTGPTGSGKTTTLYSALSDLNAKSVNISTAEDPVEYNIYGINQVQINEDIGLTFAAALRSFLRQDPDIIMVGEIRDLETAEIAIKAALTGHLVLSTIHTNNAASTISRLINVGVESFLVASSLNLIIAQRLIRKLCNECKEPYKPDNILLKGFGFEDSNVSRNLFYKPKGCSACMNTGYKGRIAIYEVLTVTDDIKDLIYKNANEFEIENLAVKNHKMITLSESAKEKFISGITSLEEILQYLKTNNNNIII
ncbi:MAG: type IV-A pilus assembly ATPase PilB [Candidatus Acididesulfobacter diazotrophicus]|uniref:Type IV-A pilus assembly ATPase PilB n=1 Tax=Candidatus Acididesulfobacter diazotrophicus TaxID=2597226 RepID=A0A519BNQ7_9DELT|nr:MAG: type IV-A pilus assembly ATPase PilB [Candidatus Acididesulfobacter diazotrophicus]